MYADVLTPYRLVSMSVPIKDLYVAADLRSKPTPPAPAVHAPSSKAGSVQAAPRLSSAGTKTRTGPSIGASSMPSAVMARP